MQTFDASPWQAEADSLESRVLESLVFSRTQTPELRHAGALMIDYRTLVIEAAPDHPEGLSLEQRKRFAFEFQDQKSRQFLESASSHPNYRYFEREVAEQMLRQATMLGSEVSTHVFYLGHAIDGLSSEFDLMMSALDRTSSEPEFFSLASKLMVNVLAFESVLQAMVDGNDTMLGVNLQEMGDRSSIEDFLEDIPDIKSRLELVLVR
jgi:hypothetical protein